MRPNEWKGLLVPGLVVAALASMACGEVRGAPRMRRPGPSGPGVSVVRIEGRIAALNAATGQVALATARGLMTLVVTPATKVELNGVRVPLALLQVGDAAQAIATSTGLALKLEAVRAVAVRRKGTDDPAGHKRKGADDAPGHKRKGADDLPGHKRKGADDPPGDDRGAGDPVPHR